MTPSKTVIRIVALQALAFLLTLLPIRSLADGQYRIAEIRIDRRNVFNTDNPHENAFIGTLVNTVHVLSRENIIRNELLYTEGEYLNIPLLKETERNLRNLPYLGDISTTIDTLNDSTVNVTVHTRDKWTLNVSPSYQQGGGVRTMSFVAKDNNFIGNGQMMSLSYDYRSDRDYPHATELEFVERRLFGSRWGTAFHLRNSEEVHTRGISVDRPFYSDEAPWAASLFIQQGDMLARTYENGQRISSSMLNQQYVSGYYARSYGDVVKYRPAVGLIQSVTSGSEKRTSDNVTLVNVSLNVMQRTYNERLYLNNHGRTEDVPTGYLAHLTFGKNFHSGSDHPDYYVQAGWQHAFFGGSDYYLGYGASYSAFLGGTDPHERTLQWSVVQYLQLPYTQTLTGRVTGVFGDEWAGGRQVILGNLSGLRGYQNFALSGERSLLYNVEDRIFSRTQLWIFHFGGVLFWDGGTAWGQGDRFADQQFHNSAGFGLRIENTKQQGSGVIRIDYAYNFDEQKFGDLIISSNVLFSAFRDFGFILPTNLLNL